MASEKHPVNVQFQSGVHLGSKHGVVTGCSTEKHKVVMEKTSSGLWVRVEGFPDRWIPDANIRFIEFK